MKIISSGFVVKNRKGEILLGKVERHSPPYQWTVFKGGQEPGEELIDTAIRELKEETGIDIIKDHRLNKNISTNYIYMYSLRKKDVYIFSLDDKDGALEDFTFFCDSYWAGTKNPEIDEYKWVKINDLDNYIFPSQRGLSEFLKKKSI